MSEKPSPRNGASWLFGVTGNFRVVVLLTLVIIAAGGGMVNSMRCLKWPELTIPAAFVTVDYPGADPLTVEAEITNKLEKELKNLPALDRLISNSQQGRASILVVFYVDADLDSCMRKLRSRIDAVREKMPRRSKPIKIEQFEMSAVPIMYVLLTGPGGIADLTRCAEELKKRLERVKEISKVELKGGRTECIEVEVKPEVLSKLGLSVSEVVSVVEQTHRNVPLGFTFEPRLARSLKIPSRLHSARELKRLPVAVREGRVIMLEEVARVSDTVDPERSIVRTFVRGESPERGVVLEVYRRARSDTIRGVREANRIIEEFKRRVGDVDCYVLEDEAGDIKHDLNMMISNGWQAMVLVFAVLLAALGAREAVLSALAIPVTFLAALVFVGGMGYTLNRLTLMALVIALGLLVDDFILIMEGMHDGLSEGLSPSEAVKETLRKYAVPSLSGTLTTIVAFLPLVLMGGVDGEFMRIIPVTVAITLTCSYLISIFILPAFGRLVLKRGDADARPRLADRLTERAGSRYAAWLGKWVVASKRRALLWIGGGAVVLVACAFLAGMVPAILYPFTDAKYFNLDVTMPPGTTLRQSDETGRKVAEWLAERPDVSRVVVFAGMVSPSPETDWESMVRVKEAENLVGLKVYLVPRKERNKTSMEIVQEVRRDLAARRDELLDARIELIEVYDGPQRFPPIEVRIQGPDIHECTRLADRVIKRLHELPGIVDIRTNRPDDMPVVLLKPHLHRLLAAQLTVGMVGEDLYQGMTGEKVVTYIHRGRERPIRIRYLWRRADEDYDVRRPRSMAQVSSLRLENPSGTWDDIMDYFSFRTGAEPTGIFHVEGTRAIRVTAGAVGRDVVATLNELAEEFATSPDFKTDGDHEIRVIGAAAKQRETFGNVMISLCVAVLLILTILVVQFESFGQPFIIMLTLPMSLIGVFLGFYLSGLPFSFPMMVGLVSLAGIVVNDAIVLIETANRNLADCASVGEAVREAGRSRLRPIIVTTVTTVAGLLPLAFSDPVWGGLCFAVIFGISAATILTLVIVPAFYVLFSARRAGPEAGEPG